MQKIITKTAWIIVALCYVPLCVKSVILWDGGNGAAKLGSVLPSYFMIPLITTALAWLAGKLQNKIVIDEDGIPALRRVVWLTLTLFLALSAFNVSLEYIPVRYMQYPIICGIGLFMVLLGALMPSLQRNRLAGARFSWTLVNREVWQKSNRIGGVYTMLLGAFLIASGALTKTRKSVFTTAEIWAIVIYIVVLTFHSRLIALKIDPPKKRDDF